MSLRNIHQRVNAHVRRHRRGIFATLGIAFGLIVASYIGVSYGVLPQAWSLFPQDRAEAAGPAPRHTHTREHLLGDPLNLRVAASEEDLRLALSNAHWTTADPIDLASSMRLAFDTVSGHAYAEAPVSNLYLFGRRQDLAYQLASLQGPAQRHHVRFWKSSETTADGQAIWFGAATFDRGVGVSHNTGEITHHIAADIDSERNRVVTVLAVWPNAKVVWMANYQETADGRNGGGDRYFTDRRLAFITLPKTPPR